MRVASAQAWSSSERTVHGRRRTACGSTTSRSCPSGCFGFVSPNVVVHGRTRHVVDRAYGVVDTAALQAHLGGDLNAPRGGRRASSTSRGGAGCCSCGGQVDARLVARASGSAGRPAAWQTAYGIVVDEPPPRFDQDVVTLMDLRSVGGVGEQPTFCYVVPVGDGWLVEETVMAARPAVDPLRCAIASPPASVADGGGVGPARGDGRDPTGRAAAQPA